MKITIELDDKYLHDFIDLCEMKHCMDFKNIHEHISQTNHISVKEEIKEESLCKYFAGLAIESILDNCV